MYQPVGVRQFRAGGPAQLFKSKFRGILRFSTLELCNLTLLRNTQNQVGHIKSVILKIHSRSYSLGHRILIGRELTITYLALNQTLEFLQLIFEVGKWLSVDTPQIECLTSQR